MKNYMKLSFCGVGEILLEEKNGALVGLRFLKGQPLPDGLCFGHSELLFEVKRQLEEYFADARRDFDLPLAPRGTAFQLRCWEALMKIPYGRTASYAEIARAVGSPRAARAVGMANNKNPIAIIIPCHRVIGADSKLTGYDGGLDVKAFLLRLEAGNAIQPFLAS